MQKITKAILKLIRFSAILAAVMTILWFGIWLVAGDDIAYLGYINAGGFVFGCIACLAALPLFAFRHWLLAPLSLCLGLYLVITPSGLNFDAGQKNASDGDIRILSASLRGLNQNMSGSAVYLEQYQADIIALQEVYDAQAFRVELEAKTKRKWNVVIRNNLAILSHYPIVKNEKQDSDGVLKASVTLPHKTFDIWTLRAPKDFARPLINKEYYVGLASEVREQKPDILLGDFNATLWNYGYGSIAKYLIDANKVAGFGPNNSFPSIGRRSGMFGAFARIDHIFVGDGITVSNAFTADGYILSDHYPVIADISQ